MPHPGNPYAAPTVMVPPQGDDPAYAHGRAPHPAPDGAR
ncbi:DUF4190 domain-containing protein, partial [Streptomyces sp. SID4956]|nr:DUF4190 domain-containing protein [Streptomyces sp. SID4956]